MADPLRVYQRWLIRRDLDEVLAIERQAFEYPWTAEDFVSCLRVRSVIGVVAELGVDEHRTAHREVYADEWFGPLAGFVIYDLFKTRVDVLNLAVAPAYRRRGVGRQLLEKIASKLSAMRRSRITCAIRERNLEAQLFFAACGFKAVTVLRDYYQDDSEDAYLFVHQHEPAPVNECVPQ